MKLIQTAKDLESWSDYREYVKAQLKLLEGEGPIFVSKDKFDFAIEGKPWKGHAVLAGPKAILAIKSLKKEGVIFREGTVTAAGKDLEVAGLVPKLIKEAEKTFLKLRLGYKLTAAPGAAGEDGGEDADTDALEADWKKLKAAMSERIKAALAAGGANQKALMELVREATQREKSGDFGGAIESFRQAVPLLAGSPEAASQLVAQAAKIERAVEIWKKTEEAATKELRKLQKAILGLNHPAGAPVIKGLESILTRLDRVDDEARAAADAAQRGDATGFAKAQSDFQAKMARMLAYVESDPLIAEADANPSVQIKIKETLTKSLNQLVKSV